MYNRKEYEFKNKTKIKEQQRIRSAKHYLLHRKEINEYLLQNKDIIAAKHRERALKRNYNLSLEQYNELLIKQNGVCAICFNPEVRMLSSGKIPPLAIDHNHITGKVRGLVCTKCNKALGGFNDSLVLLESAKQYLIKAI